MTFILQIETSLAEVELMVRDYNRLPKTIVSDRQRLRGIREPGTHLNAFMVSRSKKIYKKTMA